MRRAAPAQAIRCRLLGAFEIRVGGRPLAVGSAKLRVLLASLLLEAGRPVPLERLAESLWGKARPEKPRRAIQLYVVRARKLLSAETGDPVIDTVGDGYRMNVPAGSTDIGRFQGHLARAAVAARAGHVQAQAAALREALAEWRGEPLLGIRSERLRKEVGGRLQEQWLRAKEQLFDIELRGGRHADLVDELVLLTAQHPAREPLWRQLIVALHRSGRRTDALAAYDTLRQRLAAEFGIEPSEDLRSLYATALASPRVLHHCQKELRRLRDLGDQQGQAAAWDRLGSVYRRLGQHRRAIVCYQQALGPARAAGGRYEEVESLVRAGDVHSALGDAEAAREMWGKALNILAEPG